MRVIQLLIGALPPTPLQPEAAGRWNPGGRCMSAVLPEGEGRGDRLRVGAHPKEGYRRLAWMMVDANVAYLSPASVYRVLNDADLLYRWKRSHRTGEKPAVPTRPNQRWHTDIMHLRVADTWYFLVTLIDGYSRYVVHWELLTTMRAADVRLVIQHALELRQLKDVEIVSDNGSQFTSADFKALVRQFELQHIRIRTYHPESNGTIERFHRSTREALEDADLRNLSHARKLIGCWVKHYNEIRLHASLQYCRRSSTSPVSRSAYWVTDWESWCELVGNVRSSIVRDRQAA